MSRVAREQKIEDEQKVGKVLRTHAKDSVESIARLCHLTPQKVARIISNLEREHQIWGYSTVLDDEALGLRHYYLFIRRTNTPLTKAEVETILFTRLDDIVSGAVIIENIEILNGSSDVVFSFFATDIVPAKKFVETFNKKYNKFIQDIHLYESIYSVRRRGLRNPNIGKNLNLPLVDDSVNIKDLVIRLEHTLVKTSKNPITHEEELVASLLRTHGKDTIDSIAKHCKLSPQKVARIIAKFEREKLIWGYSAVLDDKEFGHHFYLLSTRTTVPLPKQVVEEILLTRLDDIVPDSDVVLENIEYVNGLNDGIFTFFATDIVKAKRFVEIFNNRFHSYMCNFSLLESIYSIRRRGLRNPNIMTDMVLPLVDDSVNLKDLLKDKN